MSVRSYGHLAPSHNASLVPQLRGEVDFVIEDKASGNVSLVEVKSGKSYKRNVALSNLMAVGDYQIAEAIVLCNGNVEREGDRTYLPIYAAGWLR